MRNLILAFLVLAGLTVLHAGSLVHAEQGSANYLVIVHPDNPIATISRDFLAEAYLKRTTRWPDGKSIDPVDLGPTSSTRARFSEDVLNRSVTAVRSYWQQIIFSGRGVPPTELRGDEDAVRFVTRERGGVAYVSPGTQVGRAKVLAVR